MHGSHGRNISDLYTLYCSENLPDISYTFDTPSTGYTVVQLSVFINVGRAKGQNKTFCCKVFVSFSRLINNITLF